MTKEFEAHLLKCSKLYCKVANMLLNRKIFKIIKYKRQINVLPGDTLSGFCFFTSFFPLLSPIILNKAENVRVRVIERL